MSPKKQMTTKAILLLVIVFVYGVPTHAQTMNKNVGIHFTRAIKLLNTADGSCTFEYGKLPNDSKFTISGFWLQKRFDAFEKIPHASPRNQYVITLKGKLKFMVTDGSSFILEPGIVLISSDTTGKGHSWKLVGGHTWQRIYIPIPAGTNDHFIPD